MKKLLIFSFFAGLNAREVPTTQFPLFSSKTDTVNPNQKFSLDEFSPSEKEKFYNLLAMRFAVRVVLQAPSDKINEQQKEEMLSGARDEIKATTLLSDEDIDTILQEERQLLSGNVLGNLELQFRKQIRSCMIGATSQQQVDTCVGNFKKDIVDQNKADQILAEEIFVTQMLFTLMQEQIRAELMNKPRR